MNEPGTRLSKERPLRAVTRRVPPHNLEAEESLLGAMLLSPDAVNKVMELDITASDFYGPSHGVVFESIAKLHASAEPIDPITVAEVLGQDGQLDQVSATARDGQTVSGSAALISLQTATPATGNAAKYARIVAEHARLRDLIRLGEEIAAVGYSEKPPDPEFLPRLRAGLTPTGEPEELPLQWGNQVVTRPMEWLWHSRIPRGKITIFDGDPNKAKSLVSLDIVARVTNGSPMPDGSKLGLDGPSRCLIISAEDTIDDTIAPRLKAAGADMSMVAFHRLARDPVTGKAEPLSIPRDIERFATTISEQRIVLAIIEPLTAYLDETINSHNDASVRRAMSPLTLTAEETGCAVVLIRHLNKGTGLSAIHRGGGSVGIGGAARSVLVFASHPDTPDRYVMAQAKANLAARGSCPSLGYRVDSAVTMDGSQPVIAWEPGTVSLTADQLLGSLDSRKDAPAQEEAATWLEETLTSGSMPASILKDKAKGAGLSWRTVERARRNGLTNVVTNRIRNENGTTAEWEWRLAGE